MNENDPKVAAGSVLCALCHNPAAHMRVTKDGIVCHGCYLSSTANVPQERTRV